MSSSAKKSRRFPWFENCEVCAYSRQVDDQNRKMRLEELRATFRRAQLRQNLSR